MACHKPKISLFPDNQIIRGSSYRFPLSAPRSEPATISVEFDVTGFVGVMPIPGDYYQANGIYFQVTSTEPGLIRASSSVTDLGLLGLTGDLEAKGATTGDPLIPYGGFNDKILDGSGALILNTKTDLTGSTITLSLFSKSSGAIVPAILEINVTGVLLDSYTQLLEITDGQTGNLGTEIKTLYLAIKIETAVGMVLQFPYSDFEPLEVLG